MRFPPSEVKVLWHVVKFRLKAEATSEERDGYLAALRGLAGAVPSLRFLRAELSVDEPDVIGLLTGFDDVAGLDAYREHPEHLPVIDYTKRVVAEVVRFDIVTDDPSDALPLS